MTKKTRLLSFLLVLIVAISAGFFYGRFIADTRQSPSELTNLRLDFRTDYILMVAEIFQGEQDINAAVRRLTVLDEDWRKLLDEATYFGKTVGYSEDDLQIMNRLKEALD